MLVRSVECKECKSLIFSRTEDDVRECDCGRITVFGGPVYFKYEAAPGTPHEVKKININADAQALYDDWDSMEDNFGLIRADSPSHQSTCVF